jgi:hypothetical protein
MKGSWVNICIGNNSLVTEEKYFCLSKFIFTQLQIYIDRLKINTHRNPDQKLYKRMPFSCHTCAFHFCDMSLITACAIFCSLKFHVVCIYFLSRNHLPPGKSENDQDSCCIHICLSTLLFKSSIFESCFGNDNIFITQPLNCFVSH